jgi:competence ComEA-like helix-hairpin-helix protein
MRIATRNLCLLAAASLAIALAADNDGSQLPAGPGKELTAKVCIDCHGASNFRKFRLEEGDWADKVSDMVDKGAKADDRQQAEIVAYLVKNFGKDSKVDMNTAPVRELTAVLKFTADEAQALVTYRAGHDPFKEWTDVAKVPGIDSARVESQKDKMAF